MVIVSIFKKETKIVHLIKMKHNNFINSIALFRQYESLTCLGRWLKLFHSVKPNGYSSINLLSI